MCPRQAGARIAVALQLLMLTVGLVRGDKGTALPNQCRDSIRPGSEFFPSRIRRRRFGLVRQRCVSNRDPYRFRLDR